MDDSAADAHSDADSGVDASDPAIHPGADLTPKQRAFAEYLIVSANKASAYRAAFPDSSVATANKNGPRLAQDSRVQRYMEHLRNRGGALSVATAASIRRSLNGMMDFDMSRAFYPADHPNAGSLMQPHEWPDDVKRVVEGYEVQWGNTNKRGIKIPSRIAAARLLAEMGGHLGQKQAPAGSTVFNLHLDGGKSLKAKAVKEKVISPHSKSLNAKGAKSAKHVPAIIEQQHKQQVIGDLTAQNAAEPASPFAVRPPAGLFR